jgi:hypothetical protein
MMNRIDVHDGTNGSRTQDLVWQGIDARSRKDAWVLDWDFDGPLVWEECVY